MATALKGLKKKWLAIAKEAKTLTVAANEFLQDANDEGRGKELIAKMEDVLKAAEDVEYRILPSLDNDEEEQDRLISDSMVMAQTVREQIRKVQAHAQPRKSDAISSTVITSSTSTPAASPNTVPSALSVALPTSLSVTSSAVSIDTLSPQNNAAAAPRGPTPHHRFNLPRLELPKFEGNPLNWLSFIDKFQAAVDSDHSLAPVEKLQYLIAQLAGDAAQLVEGLVISNANYTHAMQLLRNRYGKPEILISTYINAIVKLPPPFNDAESLREFHDKLEANIRCLASLGETSAANSTMLVSIIKEKLPGEIQTQLYRENNSGTWTLNELMQGLMKEINAKSCGNVAKPSSSHNAQCYATASFFINARRRPTPQKAQPQKKTSCVYCSQQHFSAQCTTVADINKRKEVLRQSRRCFNCLSNGHAIKNCTSKFTCRTCKGKHHTSICSAHNALTPTPINDHANTHPPPPTNDQTNQSAHVTLAPTSGATLLKTATGTMRNGNTKAQVNILFDEGSQRTFITDATSQRLNVNISSCQTETINLSTFGENTSKAIIYPVTSLKLLTHEGYVSLSAIVVPSIAAPIRNHVPQVKADHDYLKYLPLANLANTNHLEIDVLIGADFYWSIVKNEVIRGSGPTAVASKLGFLLSGPANSPNIADTHSSTLTTTCLKVSVDSSNEIKDLAATYWDLETVGIKENPNESKFDLQSYCNDKIQQGNDGKYIASLPWKAEHPDLPTNYAITNARTRAMIRRLDSATIELYHSIIQDQVQKDFIEQIPNDDTAVGHYIPHHGIAKESSTTPLRIVYDCSCSTRNAPSLNDCLESGTALVNDLVAILLRFRTHDIVFTSDIEKAFLNVRLPEADRNFTKFLWLSDPRNPRSDFLAYRFKSVLFGSTSSPFMLNAVLKTHLAKYKSTAAQNIQNNIYVDNLVTGVSTSSDQLDCTQKAINFYREANTILHDAGFNLRSWSTNDPSVRRIIKSDFNRDNETVINLLGLKWHTSDDYITFTNKSGASTEANPTLITKRDVLKQSASLFDPMGLLSPVHVQAKIFIQQLWSHKCTWDEALSPALAAQWLQISAELISARTTMINRKYFICLPSDVVELHVFCDASKCAYGAAAYLRYKQSTALVMAKTRVKPLKAISLPRLELLATVIGARLANFVKSALRDSSVMIIQSILWTDSQITLHWIACEKSLPVFVSNRVREVNNANFVAHLHCASKDNPADLLTRGITTKQLQQSSLWWHGPQWLAEFVRPSPPIATETVLPCLSDCCEVDTPNMPSQQTVLATTSQSSTGLHAIIDVNRFSRLDILLRSTAYVRRFTLMLQTHQPISGPITVQEIADAEKLWTLDVQARYFPDEVLGKPTTLTRQLRLLVDSQGILRCAHRLQNSSLQPNAKNPILLPPNDHFTSLLIRKAHFMVMHDGLLSTITYLRHTHWIPNIRQRVRSVLRKCVLCLAISGQPYRAPLSPPLPAWRIQEAAPFTVTGVDYTGNLYYKDDNSKMNKCYICLFTCAVTRAIHLEIVLDQSTEAFIRAFRRFISRRSIPTQIISDNSSTFSSAAQHSFLLQHKVKWTFIPKRAPWYGGFYERMIGMTKTVLIKTLWRATVTLDELSTVVAEAEATINDRPLTAITNDADEPTPLTPSHLIHGRPLKILPDAELNTDVSQDPPYEPSHSSIIAKLNNFKLLVSAFWQRWQHEYLPLLRDYHGRTTIRGTTRKNIVKVGDVVIVHTDNEKRLRWPLAKVVELHTGADGFVRSATIRTSKGQHTTRPIAKLYPLEIPIATNEAQHSPLNTTAESTSRPVREAADRALANIYQQQAI